MSSVILLLRSLMKFLLLHITHILLCITIYLLLFLEAWLLSLTFWKCTIIYLNVHLFIHCAGHVRSFQFRNSFLSFLEYFLHYFFISLPYFLDISPPHTNTLPYSISIHFLWSYFLTFLLFL